MAEYVPLFVGERVSFITDMGQFFTSTRALHFVLALIVGLDPKSPQTP